MKKFSLLFIFLINLNLCKENSSEQTPNEVMINGKQKFIIEIENTGKVSLKNFTLKISAKNNAQNEVEFNPDFIKVFSLDESELRFGYEYVVHEFTYSKNNLIIIKPKKTYKFEKNFEHIAKEFFDKYKNKKIEGDYYISLLYEIENELYQSNMKMISITY